MSSHIHLRKRARFEFYAGCKIEVDHH